MKSFLKILISLMAIFLVMTGCEYDTSPSLWNQEKEDLPTPTIASVDPAQAGAGVSYITIAGTNFSANIEDNIVYFASTKAEIIENSGTIIKVVRPNLVSNSVMIKVAPINGLTVATYGPYIMEAVTFPYGEFITNDIISTITMDKDENLYVIMKIGTPKQIIKVIPDGTRDDNFATASKIITDAIVGPEEYIYLLIKNKDIYRVSLNGGTDTTWVKINDKVSFGDFDDQGILYVAGSKTDVVGIKQDLSFKDAATYGNDYNITSLRVYNGYLYIASEYTGKDQSIPYLGIWRHRIIGDGVLDNGELVLDWSTTGEFNQKDVTINDITFAQNGTMFVSTNLSPAILMVTQNELQVLYKTIIQPEVMELVWGNGNSLYLRQGGDTETIIKVEMGTLGAPYYGR